MTAPHSSSTDGPLLLRPPEAAARLGLSVQRLAAMRLDGSGPDFIRAGRSVHYTPDDLQTWIQKNRRRSTSDQQAAA